jgi:hypothetical protein
MAKFQPKVGEIFYIAKLETLKIWCVKVLSKNIIEDSAGQKIVYSLRSAVDNTLISFDVPSVDCIFSSDLSVIEKQLTLYTRRCAKSWIDDQLAEIRNNIELLPQKENLGNE